MAAPDRKSLSAGPCARLPAWAPQRSWQRRGARQPQVVVTNYICGENNEKSQHALPVKERQSTALTGRQRRSASKTPRFEARQGPSASKILASASRIPTGPSRSSARAGWGGSTRPPPDGGWQTPPTLARDPSPRCRQASAPPGPTPRHAAGAGAARSRTPPPPFPSGLPAQQDTALPPFPPAPVRSAPLRTLSQAFGDSSPSGRGGAGAARGGPARPAPGSLRSGPPGPRIGGGGGGRGGLQHDRRQAAPERGPAGGPGLRAGGERKGGAAREEERAGR